MEDKKIIEMINLYFDNVLGKEEQTLLFSQLSINSEGRKYFKQFNRLKTSVEETIQEFPENLDEKILKSVVKISEKSANVFTGHRVFTTISYAFALALILISGYLLFEVKGYQDKIEKFSERMIKQSQTIEMLYNSLPEIEVRASSNNEIIIKPNS
jgi:predicted PurR-regulated permease PerM